MGLPKSGVAFLLFAPPGFFLQHNHTLDRVRAADLDGGISGVEWFDKPLAVENL